MNTHTRLGAATLLPFAALLSCTPDAPPPAPEPPRAIERQLTDTPNIERDADWSPDGQWIVFGSSPRGTEDLFLMPSTGGPMEQLTSGPAEDMYAEWSPDGSRILFTSNRGGGSDNVWTIKPDGSGLHQVTRSTDLVANRRAHMASWSPDGQSILFSASKNRDKLGIWLIPAAGGEATPLSAATGSTERYAVLSPDGAEMAFSPNLEDESGILVRNLQTGETRVVVNSSGSDWAPDWSPDGRWLAFSSWRGGTVELWVVAASGGEAFNVTNTPDRHEFVPRWSPDSRQLVFNSVPQRVVRRLISVDDLGSRALDSRPGWGMTWGRSDDELIYLDEDLQPWSWSLASDDSLRIGKTPVGNAFWRAQTSPNGRYVAYVDEDAAGDSQLFLLTLTNGRSRQVTVSRSSGRPIPAAWSPDSRTLAFTSVASDGVVDVWTVPANGGIETRLTTGRGESFRPAWSHDGQHIAFVRADSSGYRIHVMDADGGNSRYLIHGDRPIWSKDDEFIYYSPGAGFGASGVYRIPAQGGATEEIYSTNGLLTGLELSPSGSQILVSSTDPGNLFVLDVGALLDAHSDQR